MEWLIFVTLVLWFFLLLSLFQRRRRRVQLRLKDYVLPQKQKDRNPAPRWHRFLSSLANGWVTRWPRRRFEKLQLRLQRAHLRFSVGEWIGTQIIIACVGVIVAGLVVLLEGLTLDSGILAIAIVVLSWVTPDFWLSRRVTARQHRLRVQLPSTLDFLTVSVEAGLGFDQALAKVAEEMTGPIAEEIQRVLYEMQLGTPRTQALQRLAVRTGVDVIELFVSAVVQADKLGIGLTRVLKIQSEEVRRKQRSAAQEKAAKAPVKILFPLVIFVFPAMFVVILGPAVLHILQIFSSGLGLG